MLVPPENVVRGVEPVPHLILVAPPGMDALPPLAMRDGVVARCDGWNLIARLTFTVVDGPGDAGFMVPGATNPQDADVLAGWLDAVAGAGGAIVVAVDAPPPVPSLEGVVGLPGARGGTVPCMPE